MDLAVEERARCQHNRAGAESNPHLRNSTDDAVALDHQVIHRLLKQPQIWLILEPMPDRLLIEQTVGLCARRTNSRPFRRIENAELDPALVRCGRHGAAERVDFLNQMTLADPADGRVAAHLTERLDVVRQQERGVTHAR